jgi:2-iminobutanoate/2-iminopropanoate deaminase
MRQAILVPGVARLPQFSSAVRSGDFLFLSGVLGTKPNSMELVEGGAGPETKQALENMHTVLKACGADLDDVVKCTVFLCDMADFAAMNEAYAAVFGTANPPARSSLAARALALGARVEIECIAAAK